MCICVTIALEIYCKVIEISFYSQWHKLELEQSTLDSNSSTIWSVPQALFAITLNAPRICHGFQESLGLLSTCILIKQKLNSLLFQYFYETNMKTQIVSSNLFGFPKYIKLAKLMTCFCQWSLSSDTSCLVLVKPLSHLFHIFFSVKYDGSAMSLS